MGADLASWYDTITSVRDVQNHETLAYRHIWYENLLLAHTKPKTSPSNLNPYCVLQRTPCTGNPVGCFHSGKICQNILWMSTRPPPSNAFDFSIQTQQHTHTHTHTHTEAGMAGKMCPKCGVQTFFKTPTGRKCSKCEYEMRVPANNGMGGQGCRCSNCGENKVFNNTCRGCGAQFIG